MARKKKIELRPELADHGIIYTHDKAISRFMHGPREVDLETCSLNRAMAAALDPGCKILAYKGPPKASLQSETSEK
jgi:hypothetical protein